MPKVFDRVAVDTWLRDEIVQKFPRGGLGDIKLGSQLIVNPGEMAIFIRGGEPLGTFEPGRYTLTTENVPFLTDFMEWGLFGGANVFTADVYFVKTTDMTFKWGTVNPIIVEHPDRAPGASAVVGNGVYISKVKEPWRFLNAMDAFRDSVMLQDVKARLDPMVAVMLSDKLSELGHRQGAWSGPAPVVYQRNERPTGRLVTGRLRCIGHEPHRLRRQSGPTPQLAGSRDQYGLWDQLCAEAAGRRHGSGSPEPGRKQLG